MLGIGLQNSRQLKKCIFENFFELPHLLFLALQGVFNLENLFHSHFYSNSHLAVIYMSISCHLPVISDAKNGQ